jgi:hypothetical protein
MSTMKYTITLFLLAVVCFAGCSSTKTYVSPQTWNAASEGMTRQQIAKSIGQPASESLSSDVWRSEGWELRIAYDESGRTTNVARMLILQ